LKEKERLNEASMNQNLKRGAGITLKGENKKNKSSVISDFLQYIDYVTP